MQNSLKVTAQSLSNRAPIKHSKRQINLVNKFWLMQAESEGVEVQMFKEENCVGAAKINPLDRLFEKGILTREEKFAGKKYQEYHEICNRSRYARPSYDGTTVSAIAAAIPGENLINQNRIDAGKIFEEMRAAVFAQDAPRKFTNFKNFKNVKKSHREETKSKKFKEILQYIFEKQIAIKNCQSFIGSHHATLEERVKIICKTLLTVTSS